MGEGLGDILGCPGLLILGSPPCDQGHWPTFWPSLPGIARPTDLQPLLSCEIHPQPLHLLTPVPPNTPPSAFNSFPRELLLRGAQNAPRWYSSRTINHTPPHVAGLPQGARVKTQLMNKVMKYWKIFVFLFSVCFFPKIRRSKTFHFCI